MEINLAAYTPISTVDDYGYCTSVVFFRGCDLDCWYCHNKKYCTGNTQEDIKTIEEFLMRDSILTSSVTLSGGEPLLQPEACNKIADAAHALGKEVCLYTNGNHPTELKAVIKNVQRVYIDWKSERVFKDIERYTAYLKNVMRCVTICEDNNIDPVITYVAFNGNPETLDEIEDIKCFTGVFPLHVIQGILPNVNPLTPDQMKQHFANCYIRTKENGVELNG